MNLDRRKIAAAIVCLLLVAGIIFGIIELVRHLSLRNVTFILSEETDSVVIYQNYNSDSTKQTEISRINGSERIKMADGNYAAIPAGINIDTSPVYFTIDNDQVININPGFSKDYLHGKLAVDVSSLHDLLRQKYSLASSEYKINEGILLKDGSWYTTFFYAENYTGNTANYFRVIMNRLEDNWYITAGPSLIFTYNDYPEIPKSVLIAANTLNIN